MRRFNHWLALCLILSCHVFVTSLRGEDKPVPSTPLERLAPSPRLLQTPAGLKGDFIVAKEAPAIDFAVYPGQWAGANLWSCWGEVIGGSDNKFYAAIGDHGVPHGTTYLYSVDPQTKSVTQVVDYNAVVGIPKEKYAPGKIHGGLVELPGDRGIYFSGYDGGISHTTQKNGFAGHWLLRYDLAAGTTKNLGIVVPDVSVITLKGFAPTHSLYGLAIPGKTAARQQWSFFRYDLTANRLAFSGGPEPEGARALVVTKSGVCYYGHRDPETKRGVLVRFDPQTNIATKLPLQIPGDGILRAASATDKQGIAWCFAQDGTLFAFDTGEPDQGPRRDLKITELGKSFVAAPVYTTACILDPTGRYLYYVPGAHGGASKIGTPVLQFELATRQRKVLCFLSETLREQKKFGLGGTYGIALNADGSQLFINWNGAPLGSKYADFGACSAMVLHIPASERQ